MIKVISNPYLKEIRFQEWDNSGNCWRNLPENIPSKLLGTDIRKGFLPFIASTIVDRIVEEYGPNPDDINLVFEGPNDEYNVMQSVCFEKGIRLSESKYYLDNARKIIDDIKKIFEDVRILAHRSIHGGSQSLLQKEIQRFVDAVNDEIPICVLGNYSSGKSTFINALLGYELLPSGDEPTSARICRIKNSKQPDSASIKFGFNGTDYTISFDSNRFMISPDTFQGDLEQKIMAVIDRNDCIDIKERVHKVLCVLNEYANNDSSDAIADLIDIEFPISDSEIISKNDFVILDSPGSNSFSNEKHSEVLKHAMDNMSNGLPVFITTSISLDSLDNVKLYDDFRNADNLDERFTMIIINRGDEAGLLKRGPEKNRERIMNLAIPQKPCSGVYYVSSIMGLGAKNKGELNDEDYAAVFDKNRGAFENPSDRHYIRLYQYDIPPKHMEARFIKDAENQSDIIYANSGLYTIEEVINEFGGIYSLYDKCQRSYVIISKIIQFAYSSIEITRRNKEDKKEKFTNSLNQEVKTLIRKIHEESEAWKSECFTKYRQIMDNQMSDIMLPAYSQPTENLAELQDSIHKKKAESMGLNEIKEKRWEIVKNAPKDISNIKSNFKEMMAMNAEIHQKKEEVGKAASDYFLEVVSENFDSNIDKVWNELESVSEDFLKDISSIIKDRLCHVVTNNQEIPDGKRKELNSVIINFAAPVFKKDADLIFTRDRFRRKISKPYQFIESKVQSIFHSEMNDHIQNSCKEIMESHSNSFDLWMENLENVIADNVVVLNHNLSIKLQDIKDLTAEMEEAMEIKTELEDCQRKIEDLIGWKEL